MALTTVRPQGMGFNTGRRNLIINGAMQVAQRGTSAVTVSDGSNEGYTTVDRFYLNFNASIGGAIAVSQSTDAPSGFANSIKLDCTTANTSISGTQMIDLQHRIEAQDLQQLGFGGSDAQSITVSWYMKAVSFSDNISVTLETRDGTEEYFVKSFTPTTSWARYTMTVPGSTSATIDNNNGEGLRLSWVVAGSSSGTYAASSDSTAFSTTRADYRDDIGNLTASTDNELYITGVQLEVGTNASDFEHRSFDEEMRLCLRYFERFKRSYPELGQSSSADATLWAGCSRSGNSGNNQGVMRYARKRNNPTLSVSSATHINSIFPISPFNSTLSGFGVSGNNGIDSAFINATNNASSAPGSDCASFVYIPNDSGYLDVDAEL